MVLADWTFGTVLWGMLAFLFWFVLIWMFIAVFADIFRRDDLSGWVKAAWILFVAVLPLIGILAYVIVRPKMTAQDRRMVEERDVRMQRETSYSAAQEIARAAELRDKGAISDAEFERLKQRAVL
ncbi:MAG TPA: SHOCT domain-containing protein [Actinomycetes bacterium]|jgi:predicted membrane channel-forming protein YqfA (hemolysin III family)|nr:SHOCT domain-containing protein [Actinomycetes bacterium]